MIQCPARTSGVVEDADLVIVEAGVAGDAAFLTDVGGATLAAVAGSRHTPVWLVAGVGRSLPEPYWQEIVTRVVDPDLPAFCQDAEVVGDGLVDRRFGPGVDCPMLPELLRPVR